MRGIRPLQQKLGVTFTAMTPINSTSEPLAQWSINPAAAAAAAEAETEEQPA